MPRLRPPADMRRSRVPMSLANRLGRVRTQRVPIIQITAGTGVSWLIAHDLLGHPQPFFAPIAAVITVSAAIRQRRQVVIQLVLGVSIGILAGEALINLIGRGAWQIAVSVAIVLLLTTFLGIEGIARTQATSSAVLLAAVVPIAGAGNPALNRFGDALTGGIVGLLMTVIIPGNPVRKVDREVQAILDGLASALARVGEALRLRDPGPAWTGLQEARALQPQLERIDATVEGADEVAAISPLRWSQRGHVNLYASVLRDLDNAVRDTRVLARRVSVLLRANETSPQAMASAVDMLAEAVRVFSDDLSEQDDWDEARAMLVRAALMASGALGGTVTMNVAASVAQVRSTASDLLYATGLTAPEVDDLLNPDT